MKISELRRGKSFRVYGDRMIYEVAELENFNADQVVLIDGPKDVVYALSKGYPSDRIYKFHPDQEVTLESDD
jgi:hypothetical protein